MDENQNANKGNKNESRLQKKAKQLIAGHRQAQATISVRMTGQVAQIWCDLLVEGERLGLKPAEILALLLEDVGAKALRDFKKV
jgi:hypothetical protein